VILGEPWGLCALAAVPAIIVIHLWRRRFRPRPVTALFLFAPQARTMASGRRRHRLVATASLVAELVAALAATWFLCDPHLGDRRDARHVVAVVDARARMQATAADGVAAAVRARAALDRVLEDLGRDDRATLITSGATPRLLCGPAARPGDARAALARWQAAEPWHDLEPAVALARQIARDGAELTLVSDRAPARLDADVALIAVGAAAATSGLVDARWHLDGDGERIAVRVLAQGGAPRSRTLVLRDAGGLVLAERELRLEPGVAQLALFAPPAGLAAGSWVEVALTGDDAYRVDDAARVLKPTRRVVRVRVEAAPGKAAWRVAVLRALAAVPDAVVEDEREDGATARGAAHLVIGAEDAPAPLGAWRLRVVAGDAKPVLGPFLARTGHPLLDDVDFTGAVWAGGALGAVDGDVLLAAGDAVLLAERRRPRVREFDLWGALPASTIDRHPGWPSLIANLVHARRRALPGVDQPNLPLGQPTTVVLPPGYDALEIAGPDGARARLVADGDGAVLVPGLAHAGSHRLILPATADQPAVDDWATLNATILDARLGDVVAAETVARQVASGSGARIERSRSTLEHLLPVIACALAALAAWHAFAREER